MSMGPANLDLHELRDNWMWLLILGACLLILGFAAIGATVFATLIFTVFFGGMFMAGGVIEIVSSFFARRWQGFVLHLLSGFLYTIIGILMIQHPVQAAAGLTLMLAAFLMVEGALRMTYAAMAQFHSWGWVFMSGLISFVLGIMIWRRWPDDSLYFIGLFLGIELLFNGWSWVMLALAVRSLPDEPPMTSV